GQKDVAGPISIQVRPMNIRTGESGLAWGKPPNLNTVRTCAPLLLNSITEGSESLLALPTQPTDFDGFVADLEADLFGIAIDARGESAVVQLCHYAAVLADQELSLMLATRLATANV